MNTARTELIDEIGELPGVTLDVLPVLILGPLGGHCDGCGRDGNATVVLHWAEICGNGLTDYSEMLHRGCAAERVRKVAVFADGDVTVELGCYLTDVTEAWSY